MELKGKKFLVTYGPTWVPIDGMRVLSNRSSGQLGQQFVEVLLNKGAVVTALEGPVENRLSTKKARIKSFFYYDEFAKLLRNELKKKRYDVVIHAAAVSDFQMRKVFKAKISSEQRFLQLNLVPTRKLICEIKKILPKCLLVGFKLESQLPQGQPQSLNGLLSEAQCDYVVVNQLLNGYRGIIVDQNKNVLAKAKSRTKMVQQLLQVLEMRA